MGYQPGKKLYNLQFEDFPGLEVAATGTSLGKLMHVSTTPLDLNQQDEEKRMEIFNFFAERLVKWNIEHPALEEIASEELDGIKVCAHCLLPEGAPMPCTATSLLCLELDFVMRIIFGWVGAISRVSIPKELLLNGGGRNIEEEMMKLVQHQNLSTLPTPNLS